MANEPKLKESKYKSIDDILEALKDNSSESSHRSESLKPVPEPEVEEDNDPIADLPSPDEEEDLDQTVVEDEPTEDEVDSSEAEMIDEDDDSEPEPQAPTNVKTAKELLQHLQTTEAPRQVIQEENSYSNEEIDSDLDSDPEPEAEPTITSELPPHQSAVFGEPPRQPNSYPEGDNFETRYNLGPDYPSQHHEPQTPSREDDITEHSLNDLALEEDLPLPASVLHDESHHAHIPQAGVMNHNYQSTEAPAQSRRTNFAKSEYTLGEPTKKGNKFAFIIILVIGLAVIGGAVYLLKNQLTGSSNNVTAPTPIPTPFIEATIIPTPTPEPVLDRSGFKVRVLNGTSKSGLAASISGKLTDLGYKSDRVGNATNSAFLKTIIRLKPSAASLSAQLIKDLNPDLSAQSEGELRSNDSADAEVIIGQE